MKHCVVLFTSVLLLFSSLSYACIFPGDKTHFSDYMDEIRQAIFHVAISHTNQNGQPVYIEEYDSIVANIRFNTPSDADRLEDKTYGVFLPEGGAVSYQSAPFLLMDDRRAGKWFFNAEFNIADYRRLTFEYSGKRLFNEIIAFLPGITKKECGDFAKMSGLKTVPQLRSDQSGLYKKSMVKGRLFDYKVSYAHGPALDHPDLAEMQSGCFLSHNGKEYVFFEVVLRN